MADQFTPPPNPFTVKHGRWKPGESGNPGGKPKGTRNKLCGNFIHALADDFEQFGKEALAACRKQNPAAYIKAIAALCPREVEIKRPLQELEDAELLAAVGALQSYLATRAAPNGTDEAEGREPLN